MNRVFTPDQLRIIQEAYDRGATYKAIGELIGLTSGAVAYFFRKHGLQRKCRATAHRAQRTYYSRREGRKSKERLAKLTQGTPSKPIRSYEENGVRVDVYPRGYAFCSLTWKLEL